jgi:acyl carrier protein phosphodiesterase
VNFLGHLALAWPNENLMIGGFLGDFVKGPLKGEYPVEIEQGIALHRRIDARSDCHPAMQNLKRSLPKNWTRYAGIRADG